jgi:hypothetical protein
VGNKSKVVKKVYVVFTPSSGLGDDGGVLGIYTTLDRAIKNIMDNDNEIITAELDKPATGRFDSLEGKCVWELTQQM